MMDCRLSEKQKRFAEEHYGVLESFLKRRGLSFEDYYDIVVFRFLRAVKQYDEREDLKRYAFSTIANNHMRSALGHYFEKEKRKCAGMTVLSLDYRLPNSNLTFGDVVADERVNVCDEVCEKLSPTPKKVRLLHTYPGRNVASAMFLKEVV